MRERKILFMCILCALALAAAGCGKDKKSEDEDIESHQVVQISITPQATPTLVPEEVNPDAVVTNGGMRMVNEYLVNKSAAVTPAADEREEDAQSEE